MQSYNFYDALDNYHKLLDMLITQATNDLNQFYEIKSDDPNGKHLIETHQPSLSEMSKSIIKEINIHMSLFYNKIYFQMYDNHDNYEKFSAQIIGNVLEIEMHYLLEPFTKMKSYWKVINRSDEDIPEYISVKINLLGN